MRTEHLEDADLAWLGLLPPPTLAEMVDPSDAHHVSVLSRREQIVGKHDDVVLKVCFWFVESIDDDERPLPVD
jgi:hypothetical protein